MSYHYNAFISYRHTPLDSKVAVEVQKRLEHFHIPNSIKKASGLSRIARIFRDKEELPISSDLNALIEDALNNSDYLIVICSKHTKESQWVQREIEIFLKSHPRQQIMTVLAEGEPDEVMPEILLKQEITVPTPDGASETVTVPAEPLACDYRMPFKKARREELPRLAAAILGCNYDDLRQRQRRYRMQRLGIAAALTVTMLAGLAAYFAWSAAQIQANYEQAEANYQKALINQSEYLAAESATMLENGDSLTAMLLALEALPSEKLNRPTVPAAEFALSRAVHAYVPPENIAYTAVAKFNHSGRVNDFFTNAEETHLFVTHGYNTVTVWDIKKAQKCWEQTFESPEIALTNEDTLIISTENSICCCDYRTGDCIWEAATPRKVYRSTTTSTNEKKLAFSDYDEGIILLDSSTGKRIGQIPIPVSQGEYEIERFENPTFSSDGKYLAASLTTNRKLTDNNHELLFVYDFGTHSSAICEDGFSTVDSITFTDDNRIIAVGKNTEDFDEGLYIVENYQIENCGPFNADILCINTKAQSLWRTSLSYTQNSCGTFFEFIDYCDDDVAVTEALICSIGNACEILSLSTGKSLNRIEFPSAAVSEYKTSDGSVTCILADGKNGIISTNENSAVTVKAYTESNLDGAHFYNRSNILTHKSFSNEILLLSSFIYDNEWKPLSGNYNADRINRVLTLQSSTLLMTETGLEYIDATTKKILWHIPLDSTYSDKILGTPDNGKSFYIYHTTADLNRQILRIQASDGRSEVFLDEHDHEFCSSNNILMQNGILYYFADGNDLTYNLIRHDLITGERKTIYTLKFDEFFSLGPELISMNNFGSDILITCKSSSDSDRFDYYIYSSDDEFRKIETSIKTDKPIAALSEDGNRLALTDINVIHLLTGDGSQCAEIPCNSLTPKALQFHNNLLLVLFSDGQLYRYDAADGNLLGKLNASYHQYPIEDVSWDFSEEGILMLRAGSVLNRIDINSWELLFTAPHCLAYCPSESFLFMYDYSTTPQLGFFKMYSTQELIEKAKTMLNGLELTEEQKSKYGID